MSRGGLPPSGIDLPDLLHHLKKPGSPWYPIGFQGWGYGQTDGLLCPAFIRHYQIGGHGIQAPVYTLCRSIERFQINGNVSSLWHFPGLLVLSSYYKHNTKIIIEQVFFFILIQLFLFRISGKPKLRSALHENLFCVRSEPSWPQEFCLLYTPSPVLLLRGGSYFPPY